MSLQVNRTPNFLAVAAAKAKRSLKDADILLILCALPIFVLFAVIFKYF